MKWITPRSRLGDDSGVSLVLALVFITVLSLVVVAVLAFADTSMRTTMAVRNQAAESAAADGAAQAAINALRKSPYNAASTNCLGAGSRLLLNNFYQRIDGTRDSARVECELDTSASLGQLPRLPTETLLALQREFTPFIPGVPRSVSVARTASGSRSFGVRGNVFANSGMETLLSGTSFVNVAGTNTARRPCSGSFSPGCATTSSTRSDPNYTAPSGPATVQTAPACPGGGNGVVELWPGTYRDVDALNALTWRTLANPFVPNCPNMIVHFNPGTYYLDLDGLWGIEFGHVVGGTVTNPLVAGTAPAIPGSCQSPLPPIGATTWTPPGAGVGVEFVLSDTTAIGFGGNARVELCGRYSTSRQPIVFYGLDSNLSTPVGVLRALVCIVTCPQLVTSLLTGNPTLYVQGTTYLPSVDVGLDLNNSTTQVFRGGMVVRRLVVATARTASSPASSTPPVVELPTLPMSPRTVVLLNVYVCPDSATCVSGGELKLRSEVALIDPTGVTVAGARQVSVLSWSVQR